MDADNLRFLADLERGAHSEDVLIKWSMHPVVGPRLIEEGGLVGAAALPEMMRELYRQAQEPLEGFDFAAADDGDNGDDGRRRR